MKPLKQILKVVGCAVGALFFFSLALGSVYFSDWLFAVIFGWFAFCGFGATYFYATNTQHITK